MGHKLAVDELGLSEATLPLGDLDRIQAGDALRMPWPQSNAIVSNPPFHGDRNLRGLLGDDYIEWLKEEFGCGVKDHCVYWFRKAHDHLKPGQRAGMVGTNSISQNRARGASLNYIVENGGVITEAISSQDWPGVANVDVSIVNWIKAPEQDSAPVLDGQLVDGIDTALRPSTIPIADVPQLDANRGFAFQGFLPGAKFDISIEEAEQVLARTDAPYAEVVLPYLDGRDIARTIDQRPTRYTVDFGQMSLEEAMRYPAALDLIRGQAKDAREESNSYSRNPRWWQFLWPRPDFRKKVQGLSRFIAGSATAKRIFFLWCEPTWRPSNSTNMFAFDGDYQMAVLNSSIHTEWARGRSSTLEDRIRYTPSSAFETFPWPRIDTDSAGAIGTAGCALLSRRQAICTEERIGLTDLYNRHEEGAWADLGELRRELDTAVLSAYGWDDLEVGDSAAINQRLFALNREISAGGLEYEGPTGTGH
jgi:hypothetical protein